MEPGTAFTYDSAEYIQHLSYLVAAATNRTALSFASEAFAAPLGLPDLYAYDGIGEDISAGGGQMVSCRDMARVGQLVLNRGAWVDGQAFPLEAA